MLVIAIGLLVLCALTWHVETSISGHMYSVVLLGAAALCGGIGAMSNVTYWAMASRHNVWCIKAMSTGMTFGGLVTTALAVIQNAGTNPRFRVEWFLVIAAVLQAGGLLSFIPILRRSVHEGGQRQGLPCSIAVAEAKQPQPTNLPAKPPCVPPLPQPWPHTCRQSSHSARERPQRNLARPPRNRRRRPRRQTRPRRW